MMPLHGKCGTGLIEIGCGRFCSTRVRLHLVENILRALCYRLVVVQVAEDTHFAKIRQLRYVASVCGRIGHYRWCLGNALRHACIGNFPCLHRGKMCSLFGIIYTEVKLTVLKSYACRNTITWV